MKCKVKKIYILDFDSTAKLYSFGGKKRLIFKRKPKIIKNTYLEYFKTLEYCEPIQDF